MDSRKRYILILLFIPMVVLAQKIHEQWAEADRYYSIQDYARAGEIYSQLFSTNNNCDLLYNHANSLAKQGQWASALKEYLEVLKYNPNHQAAKYNYQYAKNKLQESDSQMPNQQPEPKDSTSSNQQKNRSNMDPETAKALLDALREQEIQMQKEINEHRMIQDHAAKNW